MPPPPISLFLTTIASQPALRQRQEYLLRTLQVRRIAFTSYDLASDEDAKKVWKRKAPLSKQQLPGILVGGEFPGTFSEFEDAVEANYLEDFLRLNEEWDPAREGNRPLPEVKTIGVPGVVMPLLMTPEPLRAQILASPISFPSRGKDSPDGKSKVKEHDVSNQLSGFGLGGKVTEEELRQLIADLGLEGDDAGELVKGLSTPSAKPDDQAPTTPITSSSPLTPTQDGKGEIPKRDRKKSGRLKPIRARTGPVVPLPVPIPPRDASKSPRATTPKKPEATS